MLKTAFGRVAFDCRWCFHYFQFHFNRQFYAEDFFLKREASIEQERVLSKLDEALNTLKLTDERKANILTLRYQQGKSDVEIFDRRIGNDAVVKSFAIIGSAALLVIGAAVALSLIEPDRKSVV